MTTEKSSAVMKDPDWIEYGSLQLKNKVKKNLSTKIVVIATKTAPEQFDFEFKGIFLNADQCTKLKTVIKELDESLSKRIINILKS